MSTDSSNPAMFKDFLVTLHSDVVVSQSNATLGQHQSVDYLPGSNFLGVAAQRGYTKLTPEIAWNVFHSGHVRFGDALPLNAHGQCTWPVSLSFHHYKGETLSRSAEKLAPSQVFDPSAEAAELDPAKQPQQFRNDHIGANGTLYRTHMGSRMKTAIDADSARAAEGQLYGYQAITGGQRFVFRLEADSVLTGEIFDQVADWLTGPARLGRSRGAQYGKVEIVPFDQGWQWPDPVYDPKTLTLWLMSDLALIDSNGQPTFRPEPELFQLPEGSLWMANASFLRTRCYSPYNGKRRTYDDERQVITRGSVLRFDLPRHLTQQEKNRLAWAGLYNESGLGRLAVNPTMLATFHPTFTTDSLSATAAQNQAPEEPTTPLIALLKRRAQLQGDKATVATLAKEVTKAFHDALIRARSFQTLQTGELLEGAPSRSQWGRVRDLANQHRHNPDTLYTELFDDADGMIYNSPGWDLPLGPNQRLCDEITNWPVSDTDDMSSSAEDRNRLPLHHLKGNPLLPHVIGHWATQMQEGDTFAIVAGESAAVEEQVQQNVEGIAP